MLDSMYFFLCCRLSWVGKCTCTHVHVCTSVLRVQRTPLAIRSWDRSTLFSEMRSLTKLGAHRLGQAE